MAKRGRQSLVSKVTSPSLNLMTHNRLQAPLNLNDAEIAVWNELVSDQPASAFSPTHAPLIAMYCGHVVRFQILSDEILNFDRSWLSDDEGLNRYNKLLAMSERESRAASSLATRLRITRQSIEHGVAGTLLKNNSKTRKPWELANEIDG